MSYVMEIAIFAAGFGSAVLLGGGLLVTVVELRRVTRKKRRRGLGVAYRL